MIERKIEHSFPEWTSLIGTRNPNVWLVGRETPQVPKMKKICQNGEHLYADSLTVGLGHRQTERALQEWCNLFTPKKDFTG